ncbi:hypothetical protein AGDE_03839 [Angomonas deanei]|uniref:Uncharacterized protein n=1 Tax=Angomonas deanei TaxID=59799 RepID=A0A7G2CQD2_9TRYP|nr:hypothetical protein AGDE_03839 [Angomonas deanei]CAD2221685.1 hypothetical protein, conserved [Angomonas deanei]|eukprot:EPY40089.1 hypothetical protein AGDE_03839 [Angomonas deanei]
MLSPLDIARRHTTLAVNKSYPLLKQILQEWKTYSEEVPLQAKPHYAATLHINVHRPYQTEKEKGTHVYTKSVPMDLWTSVLPWEVQRGLSLAHLSLDKKETKVFRKRIKQK